MSRLPLILKLVGTACFIGMAIAYLCDADKELITKFAILWAMFYALALILAFAKYFEKQGMI